MFKLKNKYTNLFVCDALTFDFDYYDLLIVGDILEHIEEEQGIKFIERIYGKCKDLIVSVPFNSEQGVHYDNKYEVHKQTKLTNESFLQKYKGFKPLCLRYDYGVYIKDTPENSTVNIVLDPVNIDYEKAKNELSTKYSNVIKYINTHVSLPLKESKLTVVTGLWDIGRPGRSFDDYIRNFQKLLETDCCMFIHISKEHEHLVWEKRDKSNTFVKIWELSDVRDLYNPFWEKTQKIRQDQKWQDQAGWLKESPQAKCEWYNPIVMSKYSMLHNVTIWDPFKSEYFVWVDAGITNTVWDQWFVKDRILDKIIPFMDPFLFLCYPYENDNEIHGFSRQAMDRYASAEVRMVARGGLFGGKKNAIKEGNGLYYSLVFRTLSEGLMGTEESIFTIMTYLYPEIYRKYMLDGNGLILKFVQAVLEDKAQLEPIPDHRVACIPVDLDLTNIKTSVYILTFNFPQQLRVLLESFKKYPEWLSRPDKILIDNSIDAVAIEENKKIAEEYGFVGYIHFDNIGICGGRQAVAEHFEASGRDFYIFFEDDMCLQDPVPGRFCRNGFRVYVPDLYDKVQKIMIKEKYDFLKLCFTEVYMDNFMQCSWYNVPQSVRTQIWPHYDKLPIQGLDLNVPRTKFNKMDRLEDLCYIDGEIFYANWPMIVSKEGNRKMFLQTKWAHPFEQTWMSHMFQETLKGNIKPAVLLASPINHNRIIWYKPEERRES